MINLVTQSFGRESEYKRAILTILSFYAYNTLPANETKVVLFTDQPGYFSPFLRGLPIQFILLAPEKIKQMRGTIDFLHRMKIALIQESFTLIEGPMLYADSDTFFIDNPGPLIKSIQPDKSFMHLFEYRFETLKSWTRETPDGRTFRDFLDLIESTEFSLADGSKVKYTPQHASWNAGVMIFHPAHQQFLPDVFALTDQFYPATRNHASEQYAFSLLLQENTTLQSCEHISYHYWYRVKKQIIDLFLAKVVTTAWSDKKLPEKIADVKKWTLELPKYFEEHLLMVKDHAIQAFNDNDFRRGYKYAFKAILKSPFHCGKFIKDVLYHSKRKLNSNSWKNTSNRNN